MLPSCVSGVVVQSCLTLNDPWTAACQAPQSFTVSWSLLEFMSIESVTLSNLISSSAALFSFYLQCFPPSGSFPMGQLFASRGQRIGASASVLMNIQGWFPLRLTGLISLQSKGLSRVFSSTTVPKHEFFGTQPSLWSNSHIHTWLLEKP